MENLHLYDSETESSKSSKEMQDERQKIQKTEESKSIGEEVTGSEGENATNVQSQQSTPQALIVALVAQSEEDTITRSMQKEVTQQPPRKKRIKMRAHKLKTYIRQSPRLKKSAVEEKKPEKEKKGEKEEQEKRPRVEKKKNVKKDEKKQVKKVCEMAEETKTEKRKKCAKEEQEKRPRVENKKNVKTDEKKDKKVCEMAEETVHVEERKKQQKRKKEIDENKKVKARKLDEKKDEEHEDKSRGQLKTNCSAAALKIKMSELEESPEHMKAIEELGFHSLAKISCIKLNMDLIKWIVTAFNPADTSLHLDSGQKIEITPEDVHVILGIPMGPIVVEEHSYSKNTDPELKEWRMTYGRNDGPLTSNINNEVTKEKPANDGFKFNFVVYVATKFLAPTNRSSCQFRVHKAIKNGVDNVKNMNWCSYVMKNLAREIFHYKNSQTGDSCGGCLYFLQMFYLDRFMYKALGNAPRLFPTCHHWNQKVARNRLIMELQEGGFGRGRLLQRIPIPQNTEAETSERQKKHPKETENDDELPKEVDHPPAKEKVAEGEHPQHQSKEEKTFLDKLQCVHKNLKEATEANHRTQLAIDDLCSDYPETTSQLQKILQKLSTNEEGKTTTEEDADDEFFIRAAEIIEAMEYAKNEQLKILRDKNLLSLDGDDITSDIIRQLEDLPPFKIYLQHELDAEPKSLNLTQHDGPSFSLGLSQEAKLEGKKKKQVTMRSPYLQPLHRNLQKILTADQCIMLDYAWRSRFSQAEKLCNFGDRLLNNRQEFMTLRAGIQVYDTIVSAYSYVLNYEERKMSCIDRFFFSTDISQTMGCYAKAVTLKQTKKKITQEQNNQIGRIIAELFHCMDAWLAQNKITKEEFKQYKMISFPILLESHFFVFCINTNSKKIEVMDNLNQDMMKYDNFPEVFKELTGVYLNEIQHPCSPEFVQYSFDYVKLKWKTSCPNFMDNIKDCGVFAMKHMELYRGREFKSDLGSYGKMKNHRAQIAAILLSHPENKEREVVLAKAVQFQE